MKLKSISFGMKYHFIVASNLSRDDVNYETISWYKEFWQYYSNRLGNSSMSFIDKTLSAKCHIVHEIISDKIYDTQRFKKIACSRVTNTQWQWNCSFSFLVRPMIWTKRSLDHERNFRRTIQGPVSLPSE